MFLKHLLNWNYFTELLSPADSGGGDIGDADETDDTDDTDTDADIDDTSDDDKDTDNTDSDNTDDTDDNDDDEDKDVDDEDKDKKKDDDEEDEDETEKLSTLNEAAIKKDFPELFKKYPELKAELFKAEQYSELFTDPKEAKNAVAKASTLDTIEKELLQDADPTNLLNIIKKSNADSFKGIGLSILPYLQANDKELYYEVASLPIKQLLRSAWNEGKGKETDLGRAAAFIHKYFFGTTDIAAKITAEEKTVKTEKSEAEKKYEEKLAGLENERYTDFKNSVDNRYTTAMSDLIREGLDKDERINDYMKDKLIEDILIDIRKSTNSDERFTKSLESLWLKAKQAGFSKEYRGKILTTVLSRTKAMVPEARKKAIANALRTKKAKSDNDLKDKDKEPIRSKNVNSDESKTKNRNRPSDKPLTDMDILRS